MVGEDQFIEVFVNTPLEVCEERDVKGLYAKARSGEIKGFTGIDDPYESPVSAEIVISTENKSPEDCAREIIDYLEGRGYLKPDGFQNHQS
jgi:sulfate adenylyltransferase